MRMKYNLKKVIENKVHIHSAAPSSQSSLFSPSERDDNADNGDDITYNTS